MPLRILYRPRCQLCGKQGTSKQPGTLTGGLPNLTPTVPGKCPVSPTGKHAPRWEQA